MSTEPNGHAEDLAATTYQMRLERYKEHLVSIQHDQRDKKPEERAVALLAVYMGASKRAREHFFALLAEFVFSLMDANETLRERE